MKVSVVIATTGTKPVMLDKVLHSLTLQSEKDFEVRICDDGGSDYNPGPVLGVIAKYQALLNVHLAWSHACGAAAARNLGIKKAVAPRVLIVDDDCLCPKQLVAMHATYAETPIAVVGLRRHVAPAVHGVLLPDDLRNIDFLPSEPDKRKLADMRDYVRRGVSRIEALAWTCHISYPTEELKKAGGFWEEMKGSGYEDRELALRMWRSGVKFAFVEQPCVFHMDHPQCVRQKEQAPKNRELFKQTQRDPKVLVRNGGPL